MIIWNNAKDILPTSESIDAVCNPYYLVLTGAGYTEKAMYIDGCWMTSYITKLIPEVVGWTEINRM